MSSQLEKNLNQTIEFHFKTTPFWKKRRIPPNELLKGGTWEILENLVNRLYINEDILRKDWLEFLPQQRIQTRFYQSSGTTGSRKFIHWSKNYLTSLVKYLKDSLDEIYKPKIKRAIVHGPYGWYQDEMSELVWSYGSELYFIGVETEGLKKELQLKGIEAITQKFTPLIENTKRFLERDKEINTMRTSLEMFDFLIDKGCDLSRIDNLIVSGTEVTPSKIDKIKDYSVYVKIIPFYGHFLFGDAIGIYDGKNLIYYPNYPETIIFPVKKKNGRYNIVNYGERGKMAIIIARQDLFFVTIEDEEIGREKPIPPFNFDGFSNPKRVI